MIYLNGKLALYASLCKLRNKHEHEDQGPTVKTTCIVDNIGKLSR